MTATTANGSTYQITITNNSGLSGNVVVFQQDPNTSVNEVMPMAWMSMPLQPGETTAFQWNTNNVHVWADAGIPQPGVVFEGAQSFPVEPKSAVLFSASKHGMLYFSNPQADASSGSMTIRHDGCIEQHTCSVGIGMSGSGTFVVPAGPKTMTVFTPDPQYWIAFGNYRQGQIIDPNAMTYAAQVVFPAGVYKLNATLSTHNSQNTWTISDARRTTAAPGVRGAMPKQERSLSLLERFIAWLKSLFTGGSK